MVDVGTQYGACRERIEALVADLTDEQAAAPVSACPGWSVHDVVAHLSGSVSDVLAGRMDGIGTPPWTAAQVDARREVPMADLMAEWQSGAAAFEGALRALGGPTAALAVADAWHHEQDLRGALGVEGGEDPATEHLAIEGYAPMVGGAWAAQGVAPLRVRAGAATVQSGEGDAEPYIAALAGMGPAEPLPM